MMPIGPLMVEHRLIERVIADIRARLDQQAPRAAIDSSYVEDVVDFLRTYADRTHHGKEEDILFRTLAEKDLDPPLRETMGRLIADHERARATTRSLALAGAALSAGDRSSREEVRRALSELVTLYPEHIRKEEKALFRPAMAYFSEDEQRAMLEEFNTFDASLVHEMYRRKVRDVELRS